MRKTFSKSNTLFAIGRNITQTSVFKIQKESQKTSVSLDDFHASD